MFYPESANTIAPGQTLNLISFINMIFPATNDAAGTTAAFEAAVAHAQGELSQGLTGRLSAGLPSDIVAAGWGVDDSCVPQLANTGIDSAASIGITTGASALAMVGLVFVIVARRRARA
jgi:LPXTG-motif cell wall-anchored protein